MTKTNSLTVKFQRGYTSAPFAEEFVDTLLGDYILGVDVPHDPLAGVDVDLYHKGTGNSVQHSLWTMDDHSVAVWFHLPTGQDVHVEVLPRQTVVSVWE